MPKWLNLDTLAALIIAVLLVYIGLQRIELLTCRLHSKDFQHQLERISTAKDTQRSQTKERIKAVTRTIHDADGRAKVVESAPTLPGCKTPSEVLQADL